MPTDEEIMAKVWARWANPKTNPIERHQRYLDSLTADLALYGGPPIVEEPRRLPAGWERYV
jgi:hypothetical protein